MSYHQESKVIDINIFAATVGLGNRIKMLVSSNFIGMVSSVSVIFDTGATYSCSSNKCDFVKLEYKTFPRKLKGIAKGLELSWECFIFKIHKVTLVGRTLVSISSVKYY